MDGLVWEEHPDLRRPVLVAAFKGWNDAGEAASEAASWLVRTSSSRRVAWIDPEEHYDFQSSRPEIELSEGITRTLTWPTTECFVVHLPDADRDLVVVTGVEPNYRWRSFSRALVSVATDTGCSLVTTLGALLADVPHTQTVSITGTASDAALVGELGLQPSRYEGPTGIVGVLQDACRAQDLDAVSLWAPVPHYLAGPPHPTASHALLERFGRLVDVRLELDELRRAGDRWRNQVDQAVKDDPNAQAYIEELEARAVEPDRPLPTGDDLAAEFERFLRDQTEE